MPIRFPSVRPLLLAVLVVSACSPDARRARPPEQQTTRAAADTPVSGGTAVIAEAFDMEKPLPLVWQGGLDEGLSDVMYMGLLRGAWRDGRYVLLTSAESPMALAWHYEYLKPDSSALRFRMRSGVQWSDGKPITAADVVWNYQMLKDSALASPRQDVAAQLDSVVAENDSTVVFFYKRRYAEMVSDAALPLAPKHLYAGTPPAKLRAHPALNDPAGGALVVSGPFMIGAWRRGERIELVRNPRFSPRPRLDRIVIRVIPEPATRVLELQTGRVDAARALGFDQLPSIRQSVPGVRFEREPSRFVEYLAWNPKTVPAFADAQVRRALAMAIDVPGIIRTLGMVQFATPAAGPYPPLFAELYDPNRMQPVAYDPAGARRLLAQRGWTDTDGDSILDRNGQPLRFTLLTNTGNARRADVQQIVQRQLRQVGVDVRLQQLEFNTFMQALMQRKYEAALGSWGVALTPDFSVVYGRDGAFNVVSYDSPATEQLIAQSRAAPTRQDALPFWRAAAVQIARDQPYDWLYYYDVVTAVRPRLRGMRVDVFGAYQNTWEWWIPKAQQTQTAPPPNDSAR